MKAGVAPAGEGEQQPAAAAGGEGKQEQGAKAEEKELVGSKA